MQKKKHSLLESVWLIGLKSLKFYFILVQGSILLEFISVYHGLFIVWEYLEQT